LVTVAGVPLLRNAVSGGLIAAEVSGVVSIVSVSGASGVSATGVIVAS
jgi:hypothetical protein